MLDWYALYYLVEYRCWAPPVACALVDQDDQAVDAQNQSSDWIDSDYVFRHDEGRKDPQQTHLPQAASTGLVEAVRPLCRKVTKDGVANLLIRTGRS